MTSLSNLIKSSYVMPLEQLKVLQSIKQQNFAPEQEQMQNTSTSTEPAAPDDVTLTLRDRILTDAETVANERIAEANRISEQLLFSARERIDSWWEQRRAEDAEATRTAHASGYEEGYREGAEKAEAELRAVWEQRLAEAASILESANQMREQIIQEAEPFLVELSCSIAGKIVQEQFEQTPELATKLVSKALSRRREHGLITLCVAPGQLAFMQAARDELLLSIDSQAELQIIPDPKVQDYGCIIRSSFGSIDARIDTQLTEIKNELMQLANYSDEE